uniref:Cadherin-related tumor suppressor-like n=1 Tax=Saccoglossus kowalevskii TaxID=10224 RepID=A0ABM0M3E4_SACKO|nr:PREDICTED: cadherin-related tumor suppressor-like [Saccoglossus kowalevskii]
MEVFAIDGDRGVPRQIYYEIVSEDNETDSFWVDTVPDDGGNNIGIIYTSVGLDREAEGLVNGLMTLNLSAIEEDSGDDPIHEITTFTQVTITVLDENDEAPYFDQLSYSGSIQENSQNELVVNDITMIVIDP